MKAIINTVYGIRRTVSVVLRARFIEEHMLLEKNVKSISFIINFWLRFQRKQRIKPRIEAPS